MNKLDQLSQMTSVTLANLKADDSLKQRILLSAASGHEASGKYNRGFNRSVFALCCLAACVVLLCISISGSPSPVADSNPAIRDIAAGAYHSSSPVRLKQLLSQMNTVQNQALSDLPEETVSPAADAAGPSAEPSEDPAPLAE